MVTAILLNYKRPENLKKLIQSIRTQDVPIEIIVFNNGDRRDRFDCDIQIDSSRNLVCLPRFSMSQFASNNYVFFIDDDLSFSRNDVIRKCVDEYCGAIMGAWGVRLDTESVYPYTDGHGNRSESNKANQFVNVIKGRFMFTTKAALSKVPMCSTVSVTREDDIYVSLNATGPHRIPHFLHNAFVELGQMNTGLEHDPQHYIQRNVFTRTMLGPLKIDSRMQMHKHIRFNHPVVSAELGVFNGDFSEYIVSKFNVSKHYAVDLWKGDIHSGDEDGNDVRYFDGEELYQTVSERFYRRKNITICRETSSSFLSRKPDNYFDLVYVDADHSYEGCYTDLSLAFEKVKLGGWIMGHDYFTTGKRIDGKNSPGVERAVAEFLAKYKQTVSLIMLDGCAGYGIQIIK